MNPERQVSVVELPPWVISNLVGKQFVLATAEERAEMQSQLIGYIVRVATDEELELLNGKSWEVMEQEEMAKAIAQHQ